MSLPIDHARLPKPGDTFAQKYRLECILGSGGMGVVFGATHLLTHKRVAIKWLAVEDGQTTGDTFSDATLRFIREARLAGEFHHPNVVQVYDVGESQGSFFMVMEWLEGETLADRLERVQCLSFRETLGFLVPCMHAIQRAHDAGIIHRDIKPANIFLCDATTDRPAISKVLDFGISKQVSSGTNVGTFVTRTGMLIGTPQYLAPEQLRSRPVDRRTDIYGFGVLLYQTLAGVLPFTADNFGDLIVQISTSTPHPLRELVPDLPLGVEGVVAKAMARDPDERYDTLHGLIADLEALDPAPLTAATLPQLRAPTSVTPFTVERRDRRVRRESSRSWMFALLAAATISAGVTGWILRQSEPDAQVASESIVRPRAVASNPDPVERESTTSPGHHALPGIGPFDPIPQPQLDASADSGQPIPLQNAGAAGAGHADPTAPVNAVEPALAADAEKVAAPATRIAAKSGPPTEASIKPVQRPVVAPAPSTQPQPTEPQPAAAAPARDPNAPSDIALEPGASESNSREHNPLHMNIQ